ncbi:MAG: hypothetical protein NWS46_02565 [Cyclobacteriaceae bacterium]|jgi:hypothetical protein|nr:hypothetical protein [Cyclobacteriaceae bacterium]
MPRQGLYTFILLIVCIPLLVGLYVSEEDKIPIEKMNGICFVAPRHEVRSEHIKPLLDVNADWIAVTPYGSSKAGEPYVYFNHDRQWSGEKIAGVIQTITESKKLGLKVMLKPHVWVRGHGWPGEFDIADDEAWKIWEQDYSNFILTYSKIADSLNVEMICIGTEYKIAVQKRPEFWKKLIKDLRQVYKGKLTYAANWDNYENVTFWSELDYIGIDSYFPICKEKTPTVNVLIDNWKATKSKLKTFSNRNKKSIIFTEFGYRSMDYTAGGHWEMDRQEGVLNMEGQRNALEAIFKTYWNEKWFAGGFLWKWHANHEKGGGIDDSRYTPQNKPAEQIVKLWYGNKK